MTISKIEPDNLPANGRKVIHVTTLEVGTVKGICLGHGKILVDFPNSSSDYPAPVRNLMLINQSEKDLS